GPGRGPADRLRAGGAQLRGRRGGGAQAGTAQRGRPSRLHQRELLGSAPWPDPQGRLRPTCGGGGEEMSGGRLAVDDVSQSEPEPHRPDVTAEHAGAVQSAALRSKVASGIRWGIIISIATQVGRITFMLALMRLLGPRNFGIVGQAGVV